MRRRKVPALISDRDKITTLVLLAVLACGSMSLALDSDSTLKFEENLVLKLKLTQFIPDENALKTVTAIDQLGPRRHQDLLGKRYKLR